MGKLININVERWVTAFDEGGLAVKVSSKGNVRFAIKQDVSQQDPVVVLSDVFDMSRMIALVGAIANAFKDENEESQEHDPAE